MSAVEGEADGGSAGAGDPHGEAVQPGQDRGQVVAVEQELLEQRAQLPHRRGRLDPVAHHVADHHGRASGKRDRVVPVPARGLLGARNKVVGRDPEPGEHRQPGRQQAALQGEQYLVAHPAVPGPFAARPAAVPARRRPGDVGELGRDAADAAVGPAQRQQRDVEVPLAEHALSRAVDQDAPSGGGERLPRGVDLVAEREQPLAGELGQDVAGRAAEDAGPVPEEGAGGPIRPGDDVVGPVVDDHRDRELLDGAGQAQRVRGRHGVRRPLIGCAPVTALGHEPLQGFGCAKSTGPITKDTVVRGCRICRDRCGYAPPVGRPSRTKIGATLLAGVLAAALGGCGAGQQAQTANQVPASGGAAAQVGSIQVRDAHIAWTGPVPAGTAYETGADAPLQVTIVNDSTTTVADPAAADRLVAVSSPVATSGRIVGDATITDGQVLTAGYDMPVASVTVPGTRTVEIALSGSPSRSGPG